MQVWLYVTWHLLALTPFVARWLALWGGKGGGWREYCLCNELLFWLIGCCWAAFVQSLGGLLRRRRPRYLVFSITVSVLSAAILLLIYGAAIKSGEGAIIRQQQYPAELWLAVSMVGLVNIGLGAIAVLLLRKTSKRKAQTAAKAGTGPKPGKASP